MSAKKPKKTKRQKTVEPQKSAFSLSPKIQDYIFIIVIFLFLLILLKPLAIEHLSPQGVDVLGSVAKMHSVREFKQQTGEQALWNPNLFGGMPIYHRLSPKAFSLDNLLDKLSSLFHVVFWYYFLGALGAFVLFRYLGLSPLISLVGALMFVLFPHYKSLYTEGHIAKLKALMFLPWVFVTFRYLLQRKNLLAMALFALAFGLQIRTQHYQIVFYTGLMVFALGIYPVIKFLLQKDWQSFGKVVALSLLALVLAIMMAAQPLFLAKEYLPYSMRGKTTVDVNKTSSSSKAGSGVSFDYATQWSTAPDEILTWILPHFYGGMSAEKYDGSQFKQLRNQRVPTYWGHMPFTQSYEYMGLILLMLAILGVVANWKEVTIRSLFFLLLVLVFLSFGRHFKMFYSLFFYYVPYFNKFRAPMMSVTVSYFIMVIFAVYGLKYLLDLVRDKVDWKEHKLILYVFAAFAILGIILWLYGMGASFTKVGENYQGQTLEIIRQIRQEFYQRDLIRYFVILILSGILLFAYLKKKISATLLILALGIIQIVDALQIQARVKPEFANIKTLERQYFRPTEIDRFLKSDHDVFRIFPSGQLFRDNRWVYFHQSIGGYSPIKMYAIEELVEKNIYNGWDAKLPFNWNVLKIMNVKYVITQQPVEHPFLQLVKSDPTNKLYAYYFKQYLPRAFFVGQVRVIKDELQRLKTINSAQFDPATSAILEEELAEPIATPDSSFTQVLKFTPNELQLKVYTDKQSLLVISEVYYPPGWKIFIDGKPVQKVYKTDHAIQSIVVPEGEHRVTLKFHPDSYFRNIKISYASLGIIYLILVISLIQTVLQKKKVKQ